MTDDTHRTTNNQGQSLGAVGCCSCGKVGTYSCLDENVLGVRTHITGTLSPQEMTRHETVQWRQTVVLPTLVGRNHLTLRNRNRA